jgi:ribonucleotide reductase alpha subunit
MTAYWLNKDSRTFLSKGYLREGQTAEDRIREIAEAAERIIGVEGLADRIEDYTLRGWISFSSPVWSNFGHGRDLPISCNGSYVADDTAEIFRKNAEVAMMTKYGAGTSAYFGALRARGSEIQGGHGGKSDGPLNFIEQFQCTVNVVSQSNVRRGNCAVYLPVEHPDIDEFLTIRDLKSPLQKISFGVTITDDWMEEMIAGDKRKRKVWTKIIQKRFETGFPYVVWIDTVNRGRPQWYKDQGLEVVASNLCFPAGTLVAVDDERIAVPIEDLVGTEFSVLSAEEVGGAEAWRIRSNRARAFPTGNRPLVTVTFENGVELRCTPDHRLALAEGGYVEASDSVGRKLYGGTGNGLGTVDDNETFVTVASVEDRGEVEDVFDLEVEQDHNFFVLSYDADSGGFATVLVHNCSEIALPSSPDESFVCDLSSLNLLHYDEWKDTDLVETVVYLLDAVMSEYIDKTEGIPFMEDARRFAIRHRAIGVGVLGWHSYLQSKMVPFASDEARRINDEIWTLIDERTAKASRELASLLGEPEVLDGTGFRNATRMAVAPTTSSSFILGQVSPSVEPENSNYYVKDLAKGKFTKKNPHLKALLKEKGHDDPETWESILVHGGSVQHLDFLDDLEKDVFKTFGEIPQIEIITQAAVRQRHIDQSQSINLMIHPNASVKDVNLLMIEAWKLGVKSLYYQRGTNMAQEYARNLLSCAACEA